MNLRFGYYEYHVLASAQSLFNYRVLSSLPHRSNIDFLFVLRVFTAKCVSCYDVEYEEEICTQLSDCSSCQLSTNYDTAKLLKCNFPYYSFV